MIPVRRRGPGRRLDADDREAASRALRPALLERRIEDRLQKIHQAVRPADTLRRTAPGPTHEDRTFHVQIAAATSMPSFRQKRGPMRRRHAQPRGIPRFLAPSPETVTATVFVPNADGIKLQTSRGLPWPLR